MKIPPSSVSSSTTSSSPSSPPSPSAATSLEMEGKPSPHLKKVLKSYQLTAANTLSGPNSVLSRLDHNGSSNSNIGNNSSAAPPSSASQGGNNSAVNIIASSLVASHGSLISGPPHFGLKIEKCVKALQSGEMHNNQNSNAGNNNHQGPMKLSTVLKSRMENGNGSSTVGRPTSPESQDRDRDKMQGHPKESNSERSSPASVICIEREIKKEPEEEGIIKSSKTYSHHHLHLRNSDDSEIGDGGILQGGKNGSAIVNGRNSCTSFTTSSDSRSESSCSPVNTSSPVATINMNAINHLASPPPHPPQSVSAPGASYAGNYPTRKDRLREHTPDEMMAATALAFAKELPPEGLHVTREVIHQVGPSPIVVGVKGHHSLHRSASVSTVDMPPPSAVSTPPSPHIATSVVYQPQPPPILSAPDRSRTEKLETLLEGEYISCFVVGGEKRLCFPQILTSVLRPFTLHQINQVCDELQIFCSRCSSDQLEVLKVTGVIPMNAHSCGLITKTDAERLVNSLLHRNPPKSVLAALAATGRGRDAKTANSFRVYHECFGKCKGVVMPLMYDKPDALCVECVECHGLFSPIRFVAHSHKRQENRTCHWGFDSANWRHYLMLSRDQDDRERWEKALEDFKGKFEHKRKESSEDTGKELDDHVVIKKVRYSSPTPMTSPTSSVFDSTSCLPTKKRLPFLQYSDNDQTLTGYEMDSVKKLVLTRMGPEMGAETVIRLLDKMSHRISSLEQICKTQEKTIREIADTKSGAELQAKVNTMEAELHSLKKQLLRRHGQREEI